MRGAVAANAVAALFFKLLNDHESFYSTHCCLFHNTAFTAYLLAIQQKMAEIVGHCRRMRPEGRLNAVLSGL
jgi:hypothetical protein